MVNGIINVHKEKGFTSHDVVAKLRGIVGQKKIGHTGTLDPDATGVLPVCLGKGTKLCDLLTDKDKTYEAVLLLGQETDTQDTSGQVLNTADTTALMKDQVEECILSFVGDYEQIPPMYSALKVNGKKLYELAREGKVVERKPRPVRILEINILEVKLPEVRMEVTCSKGTYIRTLCHDIGNQLGVFGCMKELIRTRVSMFDLSDSLTLGELQVLKDNGTLDTAILPVDSVFQSMTSYTIEPIMEFVALNGNPINVESIVGSTVSGDKAVDLGEESNDSNAVSSTEKVDWEDGQAIRVYLQSGEFLGVYYYKEETMQLKLKQMFLAR